MRTVADRPAPRYLRGAYETFGIEAVKRTLSPGPVPRFARRVRYVHVSEEGLRVVSVNLDPTAPIEVFDGLVFVAEADGLPHRTAFALKAVERWWPVSTATPSRPSLKVSM